MAKLLHLPANVAVVAIFDGQIGDVTLRLVYIKGSDGSIIYQIGAVGKAPKTFHSKAAARKYWRTIIETETITFLYSLPP